MIHAVKFVLLQSRRTNNVKTMWHCLHADIVQLFSWFKSIKMSGIKETANEPNIKENSNQMYLDCLPMLCYFYLRTSAHESINDISMFSKKSSIKLLKNAKIEHFDRFHLKRCGFAKILYVSMSSKVDTTLILMKIQNGEWQKNIREILHAIYIKRVVNIIVFCWWRISKQFAIFSIWLSCYSTMYKQFEHKNKFLCFIL